MHDFARRCSKIARVFSIGKSAEGRELWALEIASSPGHEQAKPRAKYVANMHGDEPTGRYDISSCPIFPLAPTKVKHLSYVISPYTASSDPLQCQQALTKLWHSR